MDRFLLLTQIPMSTVRILPWKRSLHQQGHLIPRLALGCW